MQHSFGQVNAHDVLEHNHPGIVLRVRDLGAKKKHAFSFKKSSLLGGIPLKTKEAEILRSLCVLTKRDDGFSSRFHRLVIRRKVVRPGREYGSQGNLGWTDGVGSTHRGQGFHQIVASSSGFLLFFVSHLKNQHWCEWLQTDTMCKHSFTGSRLPSEIPSQDCVRAELSSHDCVSAAHKRFHTYCVRIV